MIFAEKSIVYAARKTVEREVTVLADVSKWFPYPCPCVRACFWLPVGGLLAWNKDCTPCARACGEGTCDAWDKNVILAYISILFAEKIADEFFFFNLLYPSLSPYYYLSRDD